MAAKPSQRSPSSGKWVIYFVSDLHGQFDCLRDCTPDGVRHVGGLNAVAETIELSRDGFEEGGEFLGEEPPPDGYVVCLGGDMLAADACRLVREDTVAQAWLHLLDILQPRAYVFGNHEVRDFGAGGFHGLGIGPSRFIASGCTRNIEWRGSKRRRNRYVPPPALVDCQGEGKGVPNWALCTSVPLGGDSSLAFIGLVEHQHRKEAWGPYEITPPATFLSATGLFARHCFRFTPEDKSEPVVLLLAHYDEDEDGGRHPEDIPGDVADFREGFGSRLARQSTRPHFVLKGHDHSASGLDGIEGTVDRKERRELLYDGAKQWVPSFSSGRDGRYVGELSLEIASKEIIYRWQNLLARPARPLDASPPGLGHPPPGDCVVQGITFPPLGGSTRQPDPLYRAVCLMLRSLAYRRDGHEEEHIAVCCPSSVRTDHFVPNKPYVPTEPAELAAWASVAQIDTEAAPFEMLATGVRRAALNWWNGKIDAWDLAHLFGRGSRIFSLAGVDSTCLAEALCAALTGNELSSAGAAPGGSHVVIPEPSPESGGSHVEPFRSDRATHSSYPAAKSLCLRCRGRTYLLTAPNPERHSIGVYELSYDAQEETEGRAFRRHPLRKGLRGFLTDECFYDRERAYVATDYYCAWLLGWRDGSTLQNLLSLGVSKTEPEDGAASSGASVHERAASYLRDKGSECSFWKP